ncbi:MAG: ATP-binding protein, partial [Myxococcota bacterium]
GTLETVTDHLEAVLRRARERAVPSPKRQRYRVATALEKARALANPAREEIDIDTRCEDPELEFSADLTDVTRILINLVKNAQDALHESQCTGRISIKGFAETDCVAIEVSDDGPGVAPEVRQTIFEQGVTSREKVGGLGMGLSICRNLAIMNGGSLVLDETVRRGCRFVLRLPDARRAAVR